MAISVGVVGLGQFGPSFARHYLQHPDVERVALCDLSADKLAKWAGEFGIEETYDSLEAACASDLDALVIITQPWLHAEQVMQSLESGKHTYSAVPPAMDRYGNSDRALEACDRLVETVRRTGLNYMLGETTFFRPETIYCRQRAADFGHVVYCEGEYMHDLSHGLREVARKRWGKDFGPDKTGHVPMHYPTHATCGPIAITGAHMTEVSALGYQYPDDDWWREDTLSGNVYCNQTALFRMSNGAVCRINEFRRVGHRGREGFRIYGSEASFERDVSGAKWCTRQGWEPIDLNTVSEPLPPTLADDRGGHGGSHAYLVHEFVRSIVEERLPRIHVWEAVRYLAPGLVAHKSALRDGETMRVPDWGDPPA